MKPKFDEARRSATPDKDFEIIKSAMVKAGLKVFTSPPSATDEYEKAAKERLHILKLRRNLREGRAEVQGTEEEAQDALRELSKRCSRARRKWSNKFEDNLTKELDEACDKREFAHAYRATLRLGKTRFGAKKRDFKTAPKTYPSEGDWLHEWQEEGREGGMKAQAVDWNKFATEHEEQATRRWRPPATEVSRREAEQRGHRFRKLAKRYEKRAPKRRTCPKGTPPLELLHAVFFPDDRMHTKTQGVGSGNGTKLEVAEDSPGLRGARGHARLLRLGWREGEGLGRDAHGTKCALEVRQSVAPIAAPENAVELHREGRVHIAETGFAPLAWHRSRGVALHKSEDTGPKGRRVVPFLDASDKVFFAGRIDERSPPPLADCEHGVARGRRRETAALVMQVTSYRLRKAGTCHAESLKYLSNAFGSTDWVFLDKANADIMPAADTGLGEQRYKLCTAPLPCECSAVLVKPDTGSLMGDPFSVNAFPRAFGRATSSWSRALEEKRRYGEALETRSPLDGSPVDLSLTKDADDINKKTLQRNSWSAESPSVEKFAAETRIDDVELDHWLLAAGYGQNKKKKENNVTLIDRGSRKEIRKIKENRALVPGGAVELARYLAKSLEQARAQMSASSCERLDRMCGSARLRELVERGSAPNTSVWSSVLSGGMGATQRRRDLSSSRRSCL